MIENSSLPGRSGLFDMFLNWNLFKQRSHDQEAKSITTKQL